MQETSYVAQNTFVAMEKTWFFGSFYLNNKFVKLFLHCRTPVNCINFIFSKRDCFYLLTELNKKRCAL